MLKFIKSKLKPKEIYIIVQRIIYENNVKSSHIIKAIAGKERSDKFIKNLEEGVAGRLNFTNAGLSIKEVNFESIRCDLD